MYKIYLTPIITYGLVAWSIPQKEWSRLRLEFCVWNCKWDEIYKSHWTQNKVSIRNEEMRKQIVDESDIKRAELKKD